MKKKYKVMKDIEFYYKDMRVTLNDLKKFYTKEAIYSLINREVIKEIKQLNLEEELSRILDTEYLDFRDKLRELLGIAKKFGAKEEIDE